ncbi:MAG: NADH dehydrogenase subunit M [Dehalococcoidia bacterium]|nr:MAG: NADH dehydrogenase subunit M [Dehalococcoidia bacterium]
MGVLSVLLFLPVLGAIVLLLLPRGNDRLVRIVSAIVSGATFLLAGWVFFAYDMARGGLQFVERAPWVRIPTSPQFNVDYYVGVDGLSAPLVLLTAFLTFLAVFISWNGIQTRVREYHILLLLLETGVLGVFLALDFFLFFLFWEVELIPMYLLIGVWGSGRRLYAATKFLIYTLTGSAFMLVAIILLYFNSARATFDLFVLADQARMFPLALQTLIFVFLLIAYGVKLPVWPLHTWLPDAHGDAPTAVSVLLAGVLLKMGAYGIFRIVLTMFPELSRAYAPLLATLAVISILYGAIVTIMQPDMKRLVAYSSVSHMGYILLGVAGGVSGMNMLGLNGAALQMFTHGTITGLLFAAVGVIYDRAHTRQIADFGGIAPRMPVLASVFLIAGLASLGLPALSGFVAELLIFLGSFGAYPWAATLGAFGVLLATGYILFMYRRVFFGPLNPRWEHLTDASPVDIVPLFALVAAIVFVGIYPTVLTRMFEVGLLPILARLGG